MNEKLYKFYAENGKDASGRKFEEISIFDWRELEHTHDYIQWIFPTVTSSNCNPKSPLLDDETINWLKSSGIFRERYRQAIKIICAFWHIGCNDNIQPLVNDISPLPNYFIHFWAKENNHNQLRISRVLESTRLLGFKQTSGSLFNALVKFLIKYPQSHEISTQNLSYWYLAVKGLKL